MNIRQRLMASLGRPGSPTSDEAAPPAAAPADPRPAGFLLSDAAFAGMLDDIEARFDPAAPEMAPGLLAPVPLDVFALLATHKPSRWPKLAAWLPEMPDDSVQVGMTGAAGETVMLEAAGFIRRLLPTYRAQVGRPLHEARILDYGIGWARVARLFYKFAPVTSLYGVDAWPGSLAMAERAGFKGRLALIDTLPGRLPFEERFDLVYAFSVFTHLSERTARAAVRAIRTGLADDGLLVITIRPAEFWRLAGGPDADLRAAEHASRGFGFRPSELPPIDGEVPYGDATIGLDYIRREWPEFRVAGVEANGADPYQLLVMLTPA
jgi:hypothetical protein